MNARFGSQADEFYANSRLFLKLDLALERDTVLNFFEQIRKAFPAMRKFQRRDDGALTLEESPEIGRSRRWMRLDATSLRFGYFAPSSTEDVRKLGEIILSQAPYYLTFSSIDFEHMDIVYAFDLDYEGNHDQLLAETVWADHPFAAFLNNREAHHVLDAQPYMGIALTDDCSLQAYAEVKSRTTTYEVRTGEYDQQPLGVLLTIRRYWGLSEDVPLLDAYEQMHDTADRLTTDFLVPMLVNPIAQAISNRS